MLTHFTPSIKYIQRYIDEKTLLISFLKLNYQLTKKFSISFIAQSGAIGIYNDKHEVSISSRRNEIMSSKETHTKHNNYQSTRSIEFINLFDNQTFERLHYFYTYNFFKNSG